MSATEDSPVSHAQRQVGRRSIHLFDGVFDPGFVTAFALLASRLRDGERWRYEAALPAGARGLVQVLVGTLRGGVASATFAPQEVAER